LKIGSKRTQRSSRKYGRELPKRFWKLQSIPDSTEAIRKATSDLHSLFSEYQLVWVSMMDYTALASTPEQQRDDEAMEEEMRNRKSLVQAAINKTVD